MLFPKRPPHEMPAASPSPGARDPSDDVSDALEQADSLVSSARPVEAVDRLTEANRRLRSPDIERRLVRLRYDAFPALNHAPPHPASPGPLPEGVQWEGEPPEMERDQVTAEVLRAAILRSGCLLVRGLVPQDRVERLVHGIDRAFEGFDEHAAGKPVSETTPWYEPFELDNSLALAQKWVREGDGIFGADSPRTLFELLDALEQVGLRSVIAGYLGERPAISVKKCTLRRTPPDSGTTWWHQDGAFLGDDVRSLNVWLSLSHCGRDAPGLDIVPQRLERLVESGTEGAAFSWSVAQEVVEREVADRGVSRPIFRPGDALLFDHLFLHRTGTSPSMTQTRHAIETWFFAPSAYPHEQIPLAA